MKEKKIALLSGTSLGTTTMQKATEGASFLGGGKDSTKFIYH